MFIYKLIYISIHYSIPLYYKKASKRINDPYRDLKEAKKTSGHYK